MGGLFMQKFSLSRRTRVLIGNAIVFIALALYFQNCSNVKFAAIPSQIAVQQEQSSTVGKAGRTQVITPNYNQVENTSDIKVLLVVDNSPTMQNSQDNLNKNLSALLGEIQNYTASVKVVSTTYSDTNCSSDNCVTKPVLKYSRNISSITIDGHAGTATSIGLSENLKNPVFKFEKNMTQTQKQVVLDSIRAQITQLGTQGSSNESPLASFAVQLDTRVSSFFKKGDKALVYILTDENDDGSVGVLQNPISSYRSDASWSSTTPVDGLNLYYQAYATPYASCTERDEAGRIIGSSSHDVQYFTSQYSCQDTLANLEKNCTLNSANGCQAPVTAFYDDFQLNGKTLSERCAELTTSLTFLKIASCTPTTTYQTTTHSVPGVNTETYLFGWNQNSFAANAQSIILKTVKDKAAELFGSKFLLGVSTNLKSQSCALKTGQSYDTFFSKSVASEFSNANLFITSICDANIDDQAVKKIAVEFQSILSNDYLVNLSPNETATEVRAFINGKKTILRENIDYRITSNTFKILSADLQGFERIEIQIEPKN